MGNGIAHRERLALAESLRAAGPRQGTLCGDWDTAHLAAHLVLRDTRPDLQLETLVRRGGGRLPQALDALAAGTAYPRLVDRVQRGPAISPARITAIDDAMNTAEFAVHHEDVRRAVAGWVPRVLAGDLTAGLWRGLAVLSRLGGRALRLPTVLADREGRTRTIRPGTDPVVVTGAPLELALFLTGRTGVAQVELSGPPEKVQALRETTFAL